MNLSGPFATMILAQQGADVVKVERPPRRRHPPQRRIGARWCVGILREHELGKAVDRARLRRPTADRATLRKLDRHRRRDGRELPPGGDARARFPRRGPRAPSTHGLIYAALRGFPSTLTLADSPAYDHVIQAMTGFGRQPGRSQVRRARAGAAGGRRQGDGAHRRAGDHRGALRADAHRARPGDRDPDAARGARRSCGPTCRPTSAWSASSTSSRRSHARSGSRRPPTVTSP